MPMTKRSEDKMRAYWDERARLNAVWYVDTSLRYDEPDLERFYATGKVVVAEALSEAPTQPPSRALAVEIGSGLGRISVVLAERFDRVVGIDVSPEMVERARQLVTNDRVSFAIGDGSSLAPIDTGSADLVLTFTVFQHIPTAAVIERYIEEAGRVLRPGGVFVFQWNNGGGPVRWAVRRSVLAVGSRIGLGRERFGRNEPQFLGSRVSLQRIRRAVERGGMQLERTKGLGSLFAWGWAVRR
jgi:SAM-dependent methyltransferase